LVGRLAAVVLIPSLFNTVFWGDANHYFAVAHRFGIGRLPYRDVFWEYPPASLLAVWPARFVAHNAFVMVVGLTMAVAELAALELLRRSHPDQARAITIGWYALLIPIAPVVWFRFDALVPLTLVVAIEARRERTRVAALVAGFLVKLWPPALAVALPMARRPRDAARLVGALAVTTLAWWAWSPSGFGDFLRFRRGSGWHIESTVGSLLALTGRSIHLSSLSWVVDGGPGASDLIVTVLWVAMVVVVWWWMRRQPSPSAWDGAAVVIGTLLVTSRLLSPQYLAWLLPVVALRGDRTRTVVAAGALGTLTALELLVYSSVTSGRPWALGIVVLRNLVLVALVGEITVSNVRSTRMGECPISSTSQRNPQPDTPVASGPMSGGTRPIASGA
jgi:hypothetical protein